MTNLLMKTKDFLKKNKNYFLVFGILLVIFNFMLLVNSAWPYGGNTLAISDSFYQITTFFEHIFNWLSGKTSLFYTSQLGGGMEIFSTIEYMLLNPFYLIVLICGPENIYQSINFAIFFMIVFNSFVMMWFLNKRFENITEIFKILLSLIFAFTIFGSLNSAFVTWLIYPALTLLLIDAFLELVQNKKIIRFSLVLAWYVINCFSVGISTNLILVLIFFFYIMFMVEKSERKSAFVRLFVAYVIGALISVAILFPAIIATFKTNRTGELFSSLLSYEPNKKFYLNLMPMFLELAVLGFAGAYFITSNKKTKEFKFNLVALTILILPVLFSVITMSLSGGKFYNLACRYYFLFEVFLFVIAAKYLSRKTEEAVEKSKTIFKVITTAAMVLTVVVLFFVEILAFRFITAQVKSINAENAAFIVGLLMFSMVVLTLIVSVFAHKTKNISTKLLKTTNIVLLIVTLVFNSMIFIGPSWSDADDKKKFVQMVNSQGLDGKLKCDYEEKSVLLLNETSWNAQTNSAFSSLLTADAVKAFESMGYYTNSVIIENRQSDIIADSIMGNKYYLTTTQQSAPCYELLSSIEINKIHYYLYENKLATTGAFVLDNSFEFDSSLSYFENITKLYEEFGFSGKLYESVTPEKTELADYDKNCVEFVINYSFTASKDGILYINHNSKTLDENLTYFAEFLKDENNFYFKGNSKANFWKDIAFVKAGETYTFNYIKVKSDKTNTDLPEFKFLDYEEAGKLCTSLQSKQVKILRTKSGYDVKLNGLAGKLVVMNIKIDGLKFNLDGKFVEAGTEFNGFIALNVSSANNALKITYTYPYIWLWIVVVLVCAAICVGIYFWHKKTQLKKIEKIIYVCWWCLSCCILSVFYVFCLLLTFFKLIL